MNKLAKIGIAIICLLINFSLFGQNPNWTLPPNQFVGAVPGIVPLPQAQTGGYTYSGWPADHLHSSYSDQNGNLVFFTVDHQVFDRYGYLVDEMQIDMTYKRGHNERLILPMGNDCSRYAIIYPASPRSDEAYSSKLYGRRLYMAIYDLDAVNTANPMGTGALEVFDPNTSLYSTIKDISKRDAMLYGFPAGGSHNIYQFNSSGHQHYRSNIQIAATDLIDNCFYYVYVFDGRHIIRYKLTSDDLEYDNYVVDINPADWGSALRSEMEIIKLPDGNYRLATPMRVVVSAHCGILTATIDATTGDVINNSIQMVSLSDNDTDAEPHGVEFDPSGRYLYITHKASNGLPNALDVYDFNTSSFVTIPTLSGIENYRKSFIERYGDKMYLASDSYMGQLSNISDPVYLTFNSTFLSIPSGYGNAYGGPSTDYDWRYLLPDQVDMPYSNLAEMSCDCCSRFNTAVEKYEATTSDTWSYGIGNNPWNAEVGDVIYIRDYLQINPGTSITIDGLVFKFAPDARVIVKRGTGSAPAARLHLKNRAVFTADFRCSDKNYTQCSDPNNNCIDRKVWQGVRVEGLATNHSQSVDSQASFTMASGSMIEYAKTGIRVGHETISDYGGGIITIRDSYLKDNITGIQFDPYSRIIGGVEMYNLSKVERTSFTSTNDWLAAYLPNAHVVVNESSGLYLNGNEYANYNTGFSNVQRGYGVKITNSRVNIGYACSSTGPCNLDNPVRSEFKNLFYGIYGLNGGTATRTLYCNYNIFNDSFFSVSLSAFINPKILDNDFNVQAAHNAIGLNLISSTGYYVQKNKFITPGSQIYANTGVLISNSGVEENEIYRNTFSKLFLAGYAFQKNVDPSNHDIGLHWVCNNFRAPVLGADIYLSGSMSDDQGLCNNGVPAGNLFSHSSLLGGMYGNHKDLEATLGSTTNIVYSHHKLSGAPAQLKPLVWNIAHYQTSECLGQTYTSNSCPVKESGAPPIPTVDPELQSNMPSFESVSAQATEYADQMAALNSSASATSEVAADSDEFKQIRRENDKFWRGISSFYMADTTGAITKAEMELLLSTFQPKNIQRFASVLLSDGNQEWIGENNGVNATEMAVAILPSMEVDELPADIPEWFVGDFFSTPSNVAALNSLYIENEATYNPYFPLPEVSTSEGKSNKSGKVQAEDNTQNKLVVHPNPFKTHTTFDLSAYQFEGDNNRIEFYDLLGKKVFETQIAEKQVNLTVQSAELPTGVVIYKLFVNGTESETGKIISVK